jgi:uncharacterized protein (DUF2235 family)
VKNIILLSDGTGNGAAKRHKTNVWRLYAALELHNRNQIAMYDDGVGSQESTLLKALGGAFGYGLKRNVLELYKYLCRNYRSAEQNMAENENDEEDADRIYLFGFSRGSFTVRVLADFIAHAGLCTHYISEEDLEKWAEQNYRNYRQKYKRGYLYNLLCKLVCKKSVLTTNTRPDIEFIGVWDTVDAYVFPIDELAILWDFFICPIRFPDHDLSPKVRHACHAVCVDDERQSFHPVMWNEANENDGRIEQVWFPGVHSDVGGGYPRNSLSLVSLDWMLTKVEAENTNEGLVFINDIRQQYHGQSDWNGPQHDSRSGLAVYYRYKPRNIELICKDTDSGITIDKPKLHRSVLERIKGRSMPYAPAGIPAVYDVVATEGTAPQYETEEQGEKRAAALNFALDIAFWRRRIYIALLFTTLALISSRFFLDWSENGACIGTACAIGPAIQMIIDSLPDAAAGWFEALRQNPAWLWGFVVLYGVLFAIRSIVRESYRKHAMSAWASLLGRGEPPKWTSSFTSHLRGLAQTKFKFLVVWAGAILLFILILYLLFAVINGLVFHQRYTWGTLCKNSNTVTAITLPRATSFDISNACFATGIKIEKDATYQFDVADTELHDGEKYTAGPGGFSTTALLPFVPLRRHTGEPWLKLHGKIDLGGYETFALGTGTTTYTAQTDGELFFYVNDVVFGVWPEWDLPYKWEAGKNTGKVSVKVSKLE